MEIFSTFSSHSCRATFLYATFTFKVLLLLQGCRSQAKTHKQKLAFQASCGPSNRVTYILP